MRPTDWGKISVTVSAYDAFWRPTEQIPERAIGTSACADEYCAIDPTATGRTSRWIGGAQFEGDKWHASAYGQYYDWAMISNPTYDFQIHQFDRRWTTGGRYERSVVDSSHLTVNVGTEVRYDDIGKVGVDHYDAGSFVENISDNAIKESSIGVYSETTWSATDKLRVIGGLRGDVYEFDVTAPRPRQRRRQRARQPDVAEGEPRLRDQPDRRALRQLGPRFPLERCAGRGERVRARVRALTRHGLRGRRALRDRRAEAHERVLVAQSRQRARVRR